MSRVNFAEEVKGNDSDSDSSSSSSDSERGPKRSSPQTPAKHPHHTEKHSHHSEKHSDKPEEKKSEKSTDSPKTHNAEEETTTAKRRHYLSRTMTGFNLNKHAHPNEIMKSESRLFTFLICAFQVAILVIYAVWFDYELVEDSNDLTKRYNYARDVNIMIFFGFGFLMTFLRRYAYSAIGYTFLISAMVSQWSIPLQGLAEEDVHGTFGIGVNQMVNALFCSAAVMISYGAVLGKVTPTQMVLMAFIEPMFYWLNIWITITLLKVVDVGGGMTIHTFGCYYGLAVTFFLTSTSTHDHKDNCSSYNSDIFSLAGTLFLWIMWPSFNAAVAPAGTYESRAIINTFLSITASAISTFMVSRFIAERKFEIVHIQNSTLAGGVAMGVAAHLDLNPAGAIGIGFLAGVISVIGYRYFTPYLSRKFNIQDICGINNLHGMPGILSCLVGIFACLRASRDKSLYDDVGGINTFAANFPQGDDQPGYQTAGLFITLGIAIMSGLITGMILMFAERLSPIVKRDYFNDRTFWHLPSDYDYVIDKKHEHDNIELEEKAQV